MYNLVISCLLHFYVFLQHSEFSLTGVVHLEHLSPKSYSFLRLHVVLWCTMKVVAQLLLSCFIMTKNRCLAIRFCKDKCALLG